MSAGTSDTSTIAGARVTNDFSYLAPRFRSAVMQALGLCADAGIDAIVYETYRSPQLQALYFERGRTIIPPNYTVTNARSNLFSWHGYGLAVDVISRTREWDVPESWFAQVAEHFKSVGCKWGGDWKMKDLPHFQWGPCKPSPSDVARQLIAEGGMLAVWKAVGAADD